MDDAGDDDMVIAVLRIAVDGIDTVEGIVVSFLRVLCAECLEKGNLRSRHQPQCGEEQR